MADISQVQEQQVMDLKRLLKRWRMALLPLNSIILWEQPWHPCAIVGAVTILYFLIWLMDLNTLTTFALLGLLLNFIDFIIPVICNALYGPSAWTGHKELTFEKICRRIVLNYNKVLKQINTFYLLRETGPCMYYIISISMLCTLACVTSSLNNTFLLYVLTVVVLLWPGVQHRRIFNKLLFKVTKMAELE